MKYKKILKFLKKYYIILVILSCLIIVGLAILFRLFFQNSEYMYVKVKIGQGLWWVNTAKANIWHLQSINKGDLSKDTFGKVQAVVLGKRYYRWYTSDQYDIYIDLKIKVIRNKKTDQVSFNRMPVSVGSPIEFQFPKAYFTGTVTQMSPTPLKENYVQKIIYLTKRNALPWEFDAIKVGDSYFDGEETVFKVLGKEAIETSNISTDTLGNNNPSITEDKRFISIKTLAKVKSIGGQWVMGGEQLVSVGRTLNISSSTFGFSDYTVSKIE